MDTCYSEGQDGNQVSVGSGVWRKHSDHMRKEHRDVQEYAEESHKQAILEDDFIGQELPCKAVQDTPVAESREGALPIQKDKGLIEVSLVPIPIATGEETTKAVPTT